MPKCRCGNRATKALYNRYNSHLGDYCTPCGNRALKAQRDIEGSVKPLNDDF